MSNSPMLSHRSYTVGWICALPVEMAASRAMLDDVHVGLSQNDHDQNTYALGRIGGHNVVITCLPAGVTGTSSATHVATQMLNTFQNIRFGFMVGVGGGVPSDQIDIRLGDVAVSEPTATNGGTVQYDLGKTMQDGRFLRTGSLNKPGMSLLTALANLKAKHLMDAIDFSTHLSDVFMRYPAMATTFSHPGAKNDVLFHASYDHPEGNLTCSQCSPSEVVVRIPRPSLNPLVHYGLIASGNQVMRHGATREKLRKEEEVICFEMEAAGLMDLFPCLVIRGICDYSDSHKHKLWQPYAAMTAACYAKELLTVIPRNQDTISYTPTGTIEQSQPHSFSSGGPVRNMDFPRCASPVPLGGSRTKEQSMDRQHYPPHDIFSTQENSRFSTNDFPSTQSSIGGASTRLHQRGSRVEDQPGNQSVHSNDPFEHQISSLAEKDFQEVMKHFVSLLPTQQRNTFKTVTLRELRLTLLRIEQKLAAKSKSMNLPRVTTFLDGLQSLAELSSFSDTSEFVSYVWGSTKFLLQVTMISYDAFDNILETYEKIGHCITISPRARLWFMNNPQRDNILARVYGDILQVQQRFLEIVRIPTWQELFSSIWTSFKPRKDYIVQDLRRYKELLEHQSPAGDIYDYHQKRNLAFSSLTQSELGTLKGQCLEILKWIDGANTEEDHKDVCKVWCESGSGAWLMKHIAYVSWRNDDVPKAPIFWLNGILGSGKTVLASIAIDDCEKDTKAQTAYFYCKHGDPERTTFISVLKAILRQLLSPQHVLLSWCYDQFMGSNQSSPAEKVCREMVRMTFLNTDKIFIIIDGVDECEPKESKLILNFFGQLVSECESQDPGKLRVMFVSRDEPELRKNLSTFREVALRSDDNERDMKRFIDEWCRKIQSKFEELSEEDLKYISTSTLYRADGMFLFAKLVMTNLCAQPTLEHLQEQIQPQNFPEELKDVYDRILLRLRKNEHPEHVAIARKILGWMTCARRPLKWHEIQGAISTNTMDGTVNFAQRRLRTHIREICGSLINDLSNDRLELVHSTVKDYLLNSNFVRAATTECYLTSLCLHYLTFECFDKDLNEEKRKQFLLEGYYAFQDYAATHWSDHVGKVIDNGPTVFDASSSSDEDYEEMIGSAVTNFVVHYQLDQQVSPKDTKGMEKCHQFEKYSFYDDICHISHHIHQQRARGLQGLDEINPKPLDTAIIYNRMTLESCSYSSDVDQTMKLNLRLFYSLKWYKCSKATCYYFHEGFRDSKARDYHVIRHEKPFRCRFEKCAMGDKLGFVTQRELEKHLTVFHPETVNLGTSFSRLKKDKPKPESSNSQSPSRAKHPTIFKCPICPKRFTRQQALTHHLHVHSGEKPLQCQHCDKRFVRDSDRKRHEKLHSGEKKYICKGEVKEGILGPKTWGCGRAFLRADALASHLRSEAGQKCLQPILDEEEHQRQWQLHIDYRRALGVDLPLPQQLYDQYPELKSIRHDITQEEMVEMLEETPETSEFHVATEMHAWVPEDSAQSSQLSLESSSGVPIPMDDADFEEMLRFE